MSSNPTTQTMTEIVCNKCKIPKDTLEFDKRYDREQLRKTCKVCRSSRRHERNKDNYNLKRKEICDENKNRRKINPNRFILEDSRRSDKKKGFSNDLTKEFIESIITNGCRYCGETKLRMTLDRIDNSIGHLQSNVVPACIRCNLARGSMPYIAWQHIVPLIKEAREQGLFGDWDGKK